MFDWIRKKNTKPAGPIADASRSQTDNPVGLDNDSLDDRANEEPSTDDMNDASDSDSSSDSSGDSGGGDGGD